MIKDNPSVLTDYLQDESDKKRIKLRRKMCVFDDDYVSLEDMIKTTKNQRGKATSSLMVKSLKGN
jgi:hypothetical protein